MKKAMILAVLTMVMLTTSGCFTACAVSDRKYYAVPATLPVDAVLFPAQAYLFWSYADAMSWK